MDPRRGSRLYRDHYDPRSHGYGVEHDTYYSDYVGYYEREPREGRREYDSWYRPPGGDRYSEEHPVFAQGSRYSSYPSESYNTQRFEPRPLFSQQREPSDDNSEYDQWYKPSYAEMYSAEEPVSAQDQSYRRHTHECYDVKRSKRPEHHPEPDTGLSRSTGTVPSLTQDRTGHFLVDRTKRYQPIPTIQGQGQHKALKTVDNINSRKLNRIIPCSPETVKKVSGSMSAENELSSPKPLLSMPQLDKDQRRVLGSPSSTVSQQIFPGSRAGKSMLRQESTHKFSPNLPVRPDTTVKQQSRGNQISIPGVEGDENSNTKHQVNQSASSDTAVKIQSQPSRTRYTVNKKCDIETQEIGLPNSNKAHFNFKNKQNRPKTLVEVELVTKLKDINLCTDKEKLEDKDPSGNNAEEIIIDTDCLKQKEKNDSFKKKTTDGSNRTSSKDKTNLDSDNVINENDMVKERANKKSLLAESNDKACHIDKRELDTGSKSGKTEKTNVDSDIVNKKNIVAEERANEKYISAEINDKTYHIDKRELDTRSKSVNTEKPSSVDVNIKVAQKSETKEVEKSENEESSIKAGITCTSGSSLSTNGVGKAADPKDGLKSKGNHNTTDPIKYEQQTTFRKGKEMKEEKLSPISALQKKVMEKMKNKTSLVKQVHDLSLKLLTKNTTENSQYGQDVAYKSLDVLGRCEDFSDMNDDTMEVDNSFDNSSGTDSNLTPVHNISCSSYATTSTLTENSSFAVINENVESGMGSELHANESLNVATEADVDTNSECLKIVEDSANKETDNTTEMNGYKDNVNDKLAVNAKEVVDKEYDTVSMQTSTGTHVLGIDGRNKMLSRDSSKLISKDFDDYDSVEMETSLNASVDDTVENHDIIEADQTEPYGTCENEAVLPDEGSEDSSDAELRKRFKIKEVYVSLGKINVQGEEKEINRQMRGEVDNPNTRDGDKQVDAKEKEEVVDTDELEVDITQQDSLNDKVCQEKQVITENSSQRAVVPLSERFGKISTKYSESTAKGDAEENAYKAEFENIVNRLSKKAELSGQTETGYEDMEVEKDNNVANEAEVEKHRKETNVGVRNDRNEVDRKDTDGYKSAVHRSSEGPVEMKEERSFSKNIKIAGSSPVSFLDYSDDESDDELLRTPSAFLRSIEEINGRPVVITPTKVLDSSQNSTATTSSNDLSPVRPIALKPGVKNKFTLDGLLADHEEKVDLVREMDEINQELQDEIRRGGFVNILNREDRIDAATEFHITDEQQEMLKQFEVQESRICEDRPGVVVFQPEHYKCLFSSNLHPTHCGFTVGSNGLQLEKHLESLMPSQYKRVITSGIISQCFTRISCQTPLLRWLFFIMSVHDDYQVQQGCKKILLEILHFQHIYSSQKWAPRLIDVLTILVNYGASLESLIPCGSNTLEIIKGKLLHEPGFTHQPVQENVGVNAENLILVLQILAQSLHGPSGRYSPNDLSLLCVALCKASLDTSLKNMCAKGAFQNCITMVIRQYLEADWSKEKLKLTRMLVSITDHHHNSSHIAELLPPGQRGMFLQRGFCFLVLSDILFDRTNVSDEVLNSIQIKDLKVFISKMEELLENDTYKMSSVVTLMDLCVGVHITLNSEQREQLKSLLEQIRRVRVRDNVSMLDRTRVKDMIVRMTSKWALDIQTMKGKQTKIFEYASPMKMHIESVHTLQSSGEEEEECSDSDSDLPCKIQKLSPAVNN